MLGKRKNSEDRNTFGFILMIPLIIVGLIALIWAFQAPQAEHVFVVDSYTDGKASEKAYYLIETDANDEIVSETRLSLPSGYLHSSLLDVSADGQEFLFVHKINDTSYDVALYSLEGKSLVQHFSANLNDFYDSSNAVIGYEGKVVNSTATILVSYEGIGQRNYWSVLFRINTVTGEFQAEDNLPEKYCTGLDVALDGRVLLNCRYSRIYFESVGVFAEYSYFGTDAFWCGENVCMNRKIKDGSEIWTHLMSDILTVIRYLNTYTDEYYFFPLYGSNELGYVARNIYVSEDRLTGIWREGGEVITIPFNVSQVYVLSNYAEYAYIRNEELWIMKNSYKAVETNHPVNFIHFAR